MQKKKVALRLTLAVSAVLAVLFFISIGLIIALLLTVPNVTVSIANGDLWLHWRHGGLGTDMFALTLFGVFTPVFFYTLLLYRKNKREEKQSKV